MAGQTEYRTWKIPFDGAGFAKIPSFLDGGALTDLREHLETFLEEKLSELPEGHVYFEDRADPSSLKQIQQLGEHDATFHSLLWESPFRTCAETLLGGAVLPKTCSISIRCPA